jgi:hypothetical protein
MSVNAPEPPIERLNYFNGQRLEARDFRAEQDYQVRVRRYLNRSLYSSGIVKGCEVFKHPSSTHKVLVQPGLVFDFWGREIIVLEPMEVPVTGAPSTTPGVVFGNYLVISYGEERMLPVVDGCAVNAAAKPCSGDLAWGAPSRIRSLPRLEFVDTWPADETGKVVLAQVELAKGCSVKEINTGMRKYAVPAKPPKVRAISLEGEKNIDSANPKVLYFHIDGGFPDSVILYLRASLFSTLFYTELGSHTHALTMQTEAVSHDFSHPHGIAERDSGMAGGHSHILMVDDNGGEWGGVDSDHPNAEDTRQIKGVGDHSHKYGNFDTNPWNHAYDHKHLATGTAANTGTPDRAARTGSSLKYVKEVHVFFDSTHDITDEILAQLRSRPGQATDWDHLGNGSNDHALAKPQGTGAIDLMQLGLELTPGEHSLTFKVTGAGNGGKLHYNLYVD